MSKQFSSIGFSGAIEMNRQVPLATYEVRGPGGFCEFITGAGEAGRVFRSIKAGTALMLRDGVVIVRAVDGVIQD